MTDRNSKRARNHRRKRSLVPCDQCARLALLMIDDTPLCNACVVAATADRDRKWIEKHSRPLGLNRQLIKAGTDPPVLAKQVS